MSPHLMKGNLVREDAMKLLGIGIALYWSLLPAFSNAGETESSPLTGVISDSNTRGSDMRTVLREVGARLHKHFVLDSRAAHSIDLGDLNVRDISYAELLSVLKVNGWIVVPDGGVFQVLPDTDARMSATLLVAPDNIKALDDEWIATVLPVKNISAAQLVPILRPMLPQMAHLAAFPDRNALIIVDRCANVRRIVELVRTLENLPKATEIPVQKTQ
jgi:general secretion pathway protein D